MNQYTWLKRRKMQELAEEEAAALWPGCQKGLYCQQAGDVDRKGDFSADMY